jgi:hypothetical protein
MGEARPSGSEEGGGRRLSLPLFHGLAPRGAIFTSRAPNSYVAHPLAAWRVWQIFLAGHDSSPQNFSLKEVAEQFLELPARCDLQRTARADGLTDQFNPIR